MQTSGNPKTRKLIAIGAVVALALLSLQAYTIMAGVTLNSTGIRTATGSPDPASNSTVTVTGNGQVEIQPDRALVTIGVTTQAPSAQDAAQQNANIMTNVITALEKLGINSSEIQTISYNVYPQTNYNGGVSSITGYQVDNEIQVTVAESAISGQALSTLGEKAGAAIDAAVAQGANEVYGIQFTASSAAVHQANQQALQLAVQDASGQAKAIASALGVSVTGVVSVTTSPAYTPSPIMYDAAQSTSSTPIVAPQSLTISASVQATYAIS
jgi:uncharacterized protein YggE